MRNTTAQPQFAKQTFVKIIVLALVFLLLTAFLQVISVKYTAEAYSAQDNGAFFTQELSAQEQAIQNESNQDKHIQSKSTHKKSANPQADKIVYAVTGEGAGETQAVVVTNLTSGREIYRGGRFNHSEIKSAIAADSGGAEYILSYAPPTFSVAEANGTDIAPYSKDENQFSFGAAYQYFMDNDGVGYRWYYKVGDGEFSYFGDSFNTSILTFGRGKSVGSYVVKCEVTLKFNFSGDTYLSSNSAESVCLITAAEIGGSALPTINGVYGEKIQNFRVSDKNLGEWTYSKNNTFDQNAVLSAGKYILKYDLAPNDAGYAPIAEVALNVVVSPYSIKVVVENKVSVEDKPLQPLTFRLAPTGVLQNGDTLEMLQITLSKAIGNTRGNYKISGSSPNKNYSITFVNQNNVGGDFSVGGIYTILPNTVEAELNCARVTVHSADGFGAGAKLSINKAEGGLPVANDDMRFLGRYKLSVTDGDAEVPLLGDIKITVDNITIDANRVLYFDGGVWKTANIKDGKAEFSVSELGEICLCSVEVKDKINVWVWVSIALSATLVLAVLGLMIFMVAKINYNKKRNNTKDDDTQDDKIFNADTLDDDAH